MCGRGVEPVVRVVAAAVVWVTMAAIATAGPLTRFPRESEDYQAIDAYTNFSANEVCFSDDRVFQRGDLVPNPGPCEECRCEPPSIVCNMVKCPVNNNGCRTIQRPNQCCPEYICECEYNGLVINDGARIDTPEEPCQVCYCKGGDIMCNSVTCYTRDDCTPIVVPGQCCPKYENCPIRDQDGLNSNSNGGPNKTSNHANNNNKDTQPWLFTKTMSQPHSSAPPKTPETPPVVTTENGNAVLASDWLTERKLITYDLASLGRITSHSLLDPTSNPEIGHGPTTPRPQRDGVGLAAARTGETVAPVEEVIFTRVDMLRGNQGIENQVTTVPPVINADPVDLSSLTNGISTSRPTFSVGETIVESTTVSQALADAKPADETLDYTLNFIKTSAFNAHILNTTVEKANENNLHKSESKGLIDIETSSPATSNSNEQTTATININTELPMEFITTSNDQVKAGNVQEESLEDHEIDISSTSAPDSKPVTEYNFATNVTDISQGNEVLVDSNTKYGPNEFTTVYTEVEDIYKGSKNSGNIKFEKGKIIPEKIDASSVQNVSDAPRTQQTEMPSDTLIEGKDTTLNVLVTTENPTNYLETTTIQLIETNDLSLHSDTSIRFNSDMGNNEETVYDTTIENIEVTTMLETGPEEFDGALSKKFVSIKPIKVMEATKRPDTDSSSTTTREEYFNTEAPLSADNSKSSPKNESLKIIEQYIESTLSGATNYDIFESKNGSGANQNTNKSSNRSAEEKVIQQTTSNPISIIVMSNKSSQISSDEVITNSPFTTGIIEINSSSLSKNMEALPKVSDSVNSAIDDMNNSPPVIDLNGAVPFLQLGGQVISEDDPDEFEEFISTVSPTADQDSTENVSTENRQFNISNSLLDHSTTGTVAVDSKVTTPSPLSMRDLNTNSDKKSFKIDSSKEIVSTHIPLTPGDLKVIAEFLINKKIKPASKESDSEYETNQWLKGNLTSEDKITSILSAANVSIGIMNYTERPINNSLSISNPLKLEKYEKDDVFKGNSILGRGNSIVNKTGYLHDKYLENQDSTKSHEKGENNQYLEVQSLPSEPSTYGLTIDGDRETSTASYSTVSSNNNVISFNNGTTNSSNEGISSTSGNLVNLEAIDGNGDTETSQKNEITQPKGGNKSTLANNHGKTTESTGSSPFSLTRFISSFFAGEDLPSTGLQKDSLIP